MCFFAFDYIFIRQMYLYFRRSIGIWYTVNWCRVYTYCLYLSKHIQEDDPNRIIHIWFKNSISAISNSIFFSLSLRSSCFHIIFKTCNHVQGKKTPTNTHLTQFPSNAEFFFVTYLILICSFLIRVFFATLSFFLFFSILYDAGTGFRWQISFAAYGWTSYT